MDVHFTALSPFPLQQYTDRNAINSHVYIVMFGRYDMFKNLLVYVCMACVLELVDGVWKRWSELSPIRGNRKSGEPLPQQMLIVACIAKLSRPASIG